MNPGSDYAEIEEEFGVKIESVLHSWRYPWWERAWRRIRREDPPTKVTRSVVITAGDGHVMVFGNLGPRIWPQQLRQFCELAEMARERREQR